MRFGLLVPQGLRQAWTSMIRPLRLDAPTTGSMRSRTLLSTVGTGVQGGLRFVLSVVIGRIGGPVVLGVVNSAIAAAMFLSLLWPASSGSAASKFVARARGAGRNEEAGIIAAHLGRRTVVASVLLAVLGAAGWATVGKGSLVDGLCVAALVAGYSGYGFVRGVQFGSGQVARATGWDVISVSIGLAGVLVALAAGVRGTALVLPLAVGYGAYALAGWPPGLKARPERALRRELDVFVLLGVTTMMASGGFLQLSMVVARTSDTAVQAGQYASALSLATPASLLAGSMSLVLFPAMAESWGRGDHERFMRQTDHAMRLMVLTLVAVFGSLILCSRLLVDVIFGAKYAEARQLLPILLVAVLAISLAVAPVTAMTTRSQRGMAINSAGSIAGLIVGIVVWGVLVPSHGVFGVAIGYLCGALVMAAVPVAAVWLDGQHWLPMMLRTGAGLATVGFLLWMQRSLDLPLWSDPGFALVYLCGWVLLSWRDARVLLPPLFSARPKSG